MPSEDLEAHTHGEAHFVFVRSGQYLSSARRAPAICDERSIIYNPPGTRHRDRFRTLEGGSFVTISFPIATLNEMEYGFRLPGYATLVDMLPARILFWKIDVELSRRSCDTSLALEAACLELLGRTGSIRDALPTKPPSWLKIVCEALQERAGVNVRQAAKLAGVHPIHLARTFRRFYRCSPGEYLRARRVERAAELLLRSTLPLSMIAVECGYVDQSHLANEFKRAMSVTPSEFRMGC